MEQYAAQAAPVSQPRRTIQQKSYKCESVIFFPGETMSYNLKCSVYNYKKLWTNFIKTEPKREEHPHCANPKNQQTIYNFA